MYQTRDTVSAIKEIQKYLSPLENVRTVIPSGVYDDSTALSVMEVQRKNGIAQSGKVDYQKFTEIYKDYKDLKKSERIKSRFKAHVAFPIKTGDSSSAIRHINEMLSFLVTYYGMHSDIRVGNVYTQESAGAVKMLKKTFLMPESDFIDERFLDVLVKDYASASFFKNNRMS